MDLVMEWVRNLVIFVLLATVIDFLLPSGTFQKYTKMVVSLILLLIILSPLLKLLKTDIDQAIADFQMGSVVTVSRMENEVEMKKREIQEEQHAYILKQMAVQLEKEVNKELQKSYDVRISHISINMQEGKEQSTDFRDIATIQVGVERSEAQEEDGVRAIEDVEVTISSEPVVEEELPISDIHDTLTKVWQLDANQVIVVDQRGGLK